MFPLNTILAWNINIIMNKKYDNNNIIIASRAYFLHGKHIKHTLLRKLCSCDKKEFPDGLVGGHAFHWGFDSISPTWPESNLR
jgi:hypothetical protein